MTSTPSSSVAAQGLSPVCGSAWPARRPTATPWIFPVYGVCSLDAIGIETKATAGEILVVTDARRREVYWARYRDGVRVDGPAVDAPADVPGAQAVAGSPDHAALFALPRLSPVYPTAAGLVRAVTNWTTEPAPLVPLYLRRPDAKPRPGQSAGAR